MATKDKEGENSGNNNISNGSDICGKKYLLILIMADRRKRGKVMGNENVISTLIQSFFSF